MENDYNYGGQPNGYDPNSGVNLDKNAYDNANAGYDANANSGYTANEGNSYGSTDNNGYDSFGNPISNYNNNNNFGAPQTQGSSALAIVSLVCGIISVLGCCCYGVNAIPGIAAVITAVISMKKQNPGKGMAIAGIITGIIGTLCALAMIVLLLLGMAGSMTDYMDY